MLAASPFILEQGHCFECGGHHAQAYISTYPIARMRTRKKTRTRISLRTRRRKNLSQTNRKPIQFQVTTSHNASRTQTPLRRMALSIEFETNRKPNAHTSRLACCRSAGIASRLACCQWPLCAIPPVTPQPRVSISGLAAQLGHAGRSEALLCPRLRSSWRHTGKHSCLFTHRYHAKHILYEC